jgi:hypothetical protein
VRQSYDGSCHCGAVRFRVTADIDHLRICDCSICRKRGAFIHRVADNDLQMLTPLDGMTLYEWGSRTAKDYFCPICGILPFRRPSLPTQQEQMSGVRPFEGWAVNTRCLEGFDPGTVKKIAIHGSRV